MSHKCDDELSLITPHPSTTTAKAVSTNKNDNHECNPSADNERKINEAGDNASWSSTSTSSSSGRRRRVHRNRKRQYSDDDEVEQDDDDDDDDSDSYEEKNAKKKKRKKEEKKRKKNKKHSKREKKHSRDEAKKKKKSNKRRRKSYGSEESQSGDDNDPVQQGTVSFGKYGILKGTDMNKVKRSFETWLAEVKGIPEGSCPVWERKRYFDEYREDFNTATLPHIKYYDYDKWEMEEYRKQQQTDRQRGSSSSAMKNDEIIHREALQQQAAAQKTNAELILKSTMTLEKVKQMKQQADLRAEMQLAFQIGDKKKYERLKERLSRET